MNRNVQKDLRKGQYGNTFKSRGGEKASSCALGAVLPTSDQMNEHSTEGDCKFLGIRCKTEVVTNQR